MNTREIFEKFDEMTKNCRAVAISIQTEDENFTHMNNTMDNLPTKEKQSICFCMIYSLINLFNKEK